MSWIIFSFLAAFFDSMKDVFSKNSLKNIDEYAVAYALRFFALLFLIPLLIFIKIPQFGTQFWPALFISGSLNVITTILYMKAIKHSDLSIAIPMVTFSPLFLLMTSPLIVGEFPNFLGLVGVILIVFGSYILNVKQIHKGYLAPFKALLKEKGPKLMLLVAFIWSVTVNFDKIGIKNSSPIFWAVAVSAFIAIAMFPITLYKSRSNTNQIAINYKALLPLGLFTALTFITYAVAINLALVTYVISIKRTSTIMSVLFGYLIFKEKNIKERLAGVLIMVTGVLFITVS